ncbi:MAG: response regulator transcription factor [Micromonosporaceae bacterium]
MTGRHDDQHDRIERIAQRDLDARELRIRLIAELCTAVRFDAYAWLMIDPLSLVGTAPLVDVPVPPPLQAHVPDYIRGKYLTTVNRWTTLRRESRHVATLVDATGGDLARSLMWREVQRPLGVVDVATVVFCDRFGCWGNLDLWRMHPAAAFQPAELRFLETNAPAVTAGLRAAQARTFNQPSSGADRPAPAVLVLGPRLRVRSQTAGASERLSALNPPDPADPAAPPTVPAAALNVAAQLLAREASVDDHPAVARVHLAGGRWLTVKADRLGDPPDSDIAVTIEETSPTDRLELFARAHGLSPRERDVLFHVAAGDNSKTIARQLYLSEHTVNDHVKSVLAKTGARTRQLLLSRALGTT